MARMKRGGTGPIGVSPTNSQKLIWVSQKLGLSGIQDMQGASANIFDTVDFSTQALPSTLQFFNNTANKAPQFSNLQLQTLQAGEANSLEDVTFFAIVTDLTSLTDNSNTINAMGSIWNASFLTATNRAALGMGQLSIKIANSTVTKQFLTFESHPAFNPRTTGVSTGASDVALLGPSKIPLEAPPTLPPNQKLLVSLDIPPTGTVTPPTGDFIKIVAVMGRFGSIYAAKTTL